MLQHVWTATLTFHLGPRAIQFPQCDQLSLDFGILVNQNCRSVFLRVSLNAHIGPNLAKLDIAKFGCQLSPKLRQDAGFDVGAL